MATLELNQGVVYSQITQTTTTKKNQISAEKLDGNWSGVKELISVDYM